MAGRVLCRFDPEWGNEQSGKREKERKRKKERSNGNFSKNGTGVLCTVGVSLWSRYFPPTDELADYFSCRNYAACVNAGREFDA